MKLTAIVLLSCACLLVGILASERLKRRQRFLGGFRRLLADLATEIGYRGAGLPEIFNRLQNRAYGPIDPAVSAAAADPQSFAACFVQTARRTAGLTDRDRGMVAAFSEELGATDAASQLRLLERTESECAFLEAEAVKRCRELSALYVNLGVFAAILLAILLL